MATIELFGCEISQKAAILTGAVGLVSCLIWSYRRPRGVPPGPVRVPLIGTFAIFKSDVNEVKDPAKITEAKKKYGTVSSCYFGPK